MTRCRPPAAATASPSRTSEWGSAPSSPIPSARYSGRPMRPGASAGGEGARASDPSHAPLRHLFLRRSESGPPPSTSSRPESLPAPSADGRRKLLTSSGAEGFGRTPFASSVGIVGNCPNGPGKRPCSLSSLCRARHASERTHEAGIPGEVGRPGRKLRVRTGESGQLHAMSWKRAAVQDCGARLLQPSTAIGRKPCASTAKNPVDPHGHPFCGHRTADRGYFSINEKTLVIDRPYPASFCAGGTSCALADPRPLSRLQSGSQDCRSRLLLHPIDEEVPPAFCWASSRQVTVEVSVPGWEDVMRALQALGVRWPQGHQTRIVVPRGTK